MKQIIFKLVHFFELVTEWTGKLIAWLTLFMVLAVIAVLILRNFFEISAIALQESVSYMHAMVFMLGAAFTLKHNDHVRVDVFYHRFSDKKKAWVDNLGFLLLLLPVCLFIFIYCKDYVMFNWELKEGSNQPGGLPYLYMLKGLLLAMPVAVIIQGLAQFLTNSMYLLGWRESPYANSSPDTTQAIKEANHV